MEVFIMRALVTRCSPWLGLLLLVILALASNANRVDAQVSPLWDHYKVYYLDPPYLPSVPLPNVTLTDQFGTSTHQPLTLDRFMNPVEKTVLSTGEVSPIHDPVTHYSWWFISPPQPMALTVSVTNQFGDQTLSINDALFLLNPALKNQPGQPPIRNHYKAYLCSGPPVDVMVRMSDQFDVWQATVMVPQWFLVPAEKQVGEPGTGPLYPIVDPNQHYVCYEFRPFDFGTFSASMIDQFAQVPLNLTPSDYICVPTYKLGVTSTTRDSWGKLKRLYR